MDSSQGTLLYNWTHRLQLSHRLHNEESNQKAVLNQNSEEEWGHPKSASKSIHDNNQADCGVCKSYPTHSLKGLRKCKKKRALQRIFPDSTYLDALILADQRPPHGNEGSRYTVCQMYLQRIQFRPISVLLPRVQEPTHSYQLRSGNLTARIT